MLIDLLHRASQITERRFNNITGSLTPRQYAVLAHVAAHEATPSQTDLVAAAGIDRSTLSDLIKRLQRSGHLTRKRSRQDARAYEVRLTPAGHAALATGRRATESAEEALLSPLSAKERAALVAALQRAIGPWKEAA